MATKAELQQQLLAEERKLFAAQTALTQLTTERTVINKQLEGINTVMSTADVSFRDRLKTESVKIEKDRVLRDTEIAKRTTELGKISAEVKRLADLIAVTPGRDEDPVFLFTKSVEKLQDKYPLLLFPVRVETRFHKDRTTYELWIRVYPDTCQTEVDRNYITTSELESVLVYLTDSTYDLVSRHGNNRTMFLKSWVEKFSRAQDFAQTLQTGKAADIKAKFGLEKKEQAPPPVARTLPDRFLFRFYGQDGTAARTEISKPVAASLLMGLDPANAAGMDWLHDFTLAENAGMGIRIKLTASEYTAGFSRLVVLGIRTRGSHTDAQKALEELFENHYYSRAGLSLVPQGSTTNNSDEDSTLYSWKNQYKETVLPAAPAVPSPLINTEEGSQLFNDGTWLSQYLGIRDDIFQKVEHGQGKDQQEARSMNAALFPATVGYYLDEMMDPLVPEATIERVESFFNKYVLGRGTIPSLRIGKQPYGILPASVLSRLNLKASDPVRNTIVEKVRFLYRFWQEKSSSVKRIGNRSAVTSDDFLNILSLHPNSVSFHQRLIEDISTKLNAASSVFAPNFFGDLNLWIENQFMKAMMDLKLLQVGLNPATDRPDIIYKIYHEAKSLNGPVIDEVKDEFGLTLKEVFSEKNPLSFDYITWLADTDIDAVRQETGVPYKKKPLLYLLLRHALLLRYTQSAKQLEKKSGNLSQQEVKDKYRDNQLLDTMDRSKTGLLFRTDEKITGSRTLLMKDYIRKNIVTSINLPVELIRLSGTRKALTALANLPTARLERTFTEHIDCCTYRIDAWINGLYSVQLRKQRVETGDAWSKGVYLGAFAYLEDLKPKERGTSEGYIRAPSLAHAATGAILKNAQLTYSGNGENPFKINISSERVMLATQVLQGIRQGQGLPELMGYRFERKLAGSKKENNRDLNKYIYDFRNKFPLKFSGGAPSSAPQESIGARNVVDGIKLLNAFEAGETAFFSGIVTDNTDKTLLKGIVSYLQNILDAVKDLMMAEGVYQATFSNYERGAATLDAVSRGKYLPELEVIKTPKTGKLLTHRMALHLKYVATATGNVRSFRAALEPSVNAWLKEVLPKPDQVELKVKLAGGREQFLTQKSLGIEAIDLLHLLNFDDESSMSALDQLVITFFGDKAVENILYRDKGNASGFSFFELSALIRPLRRLLLQSRFLSANDFIHQPGGTSDPGYHLSSNHLTRLKILLTALGGVDLSPFNNLDGLTLIDIRTRLSTLAQSMIPLFNSSISLSAALESLLQTSPSVEEAAQAKEEVKALTALVKKGLDERQKALTALSEKVDKELKRQQGQNTEDPYAFNAFTADLKTIFNSDVLLLPQFTLPATQQPDLQAALNGKEKMLQFSRDKLKMDFPVEEWMTGVARVRDKVQALETARDMIGLTKGVTVDLVPLQLPYLDKDRWMAVQFATADDPFNATEKLLYTFIPAGTTKVTDTFCGLVVDEWTELIPNREETAGLSFHYNRPNAEAPQCMLLVTPPELRGTWMLQDVFDSITSTFDLAKTRAVEPSQLDETALGQFLPATILYSTLYDFSITTNLAQNMGQKNG